MVNKIRNLILIFFLHLFFLTAFPVYAADFKTDYQIDYHLTESKENLNSRVISFPKSFFISNLSASDDSGSIDPKITSDDKKTKIEMEFNEPRIGRDTVNVIRLSFDQANLFKINGNVWEVMLPIIENKDNSSYRVVVYLPETTDKKISISKPKPDSISGNQIVWNNPTTKTIYAVFGNSQYYKTNLTYNLKNAGLTPGFTEIALPPDTADQKIYLNKISEKPVKVNRDEDGNYMATYLLKPLENKTVTANLVVEIFPNPRDEMLEYNRNMFNLQKKYLLNQQKYWEIKNPQKLDDYKTVSEIYSYVVSSLNYSYERVNSESVRFGADKALTVPDLAVCMEFTDLFVAMSRDKGIYAREIEGYGVSSDPQLRPLSLSSDVLHAWPEYYDTEKQIWRSVDPTWENTSGIDYFTSFDLNHIAFVIHGKKSDYPYPAGMYKIENSKDISVEPETKKPEEKIEISIEDIQIADSLTDNKTHSAKFSIKNLSNVYVREVPVEIKLPGINLSLSSVKIELLAPYERKEINLELKIDKSKKINKTDFQIIVFGKKLFEQQIKIVSPIYEFLLKIGGSLIIITFVYLLLKNRRK